jgi:hypothetical protein
MSDEKKEVRDFEESTVTEGNPSVDENTKDKHIKLIVYFVNGERMETSEKKLSVTIILETAGFKPAQDYWLVRDNGNKKFEDYEEEIPIHSEETFTAIFRAQTPVSEV